MRFIAKFRTVLHAFLLLCFLSAAMVAQTPAVRNFGVVEPGQIYRGAQPTADGLKSLADYGIKSVINLRDDGSVSGERAIVENELHLRFVNVPLRGIGAPTDKQVSEALKAVDSLPKPVFIHCKYGEDRTGVVVAAIRMTRDHWTNQQAFQEALKFRINWAQRGMRAYILHYRPEPGNPTPQSNTDPAPVPAKKAQ